MGFLSGVVGVVKPSGCTSFDVVWKVKRALVDHCKDRRIKVGHGGTLDPFASGVLVIGVGEGCKFLHKSLFAKKDYIVLGKFGVETNTMDREGSVTRQTPFDHITFQTFGQTLNKFKGTFQQVPPQFSAKRTGNRRAYDYARQGIHVDLAPSKVTIYELDCLQFDLPFFKLRATVSAGTYIRKLVHDIGVDLNSSAHAVELERTKQGPLALEQCLKEEQWTPMYIMEQLRKWNKDGQKLEAQKNDLSALYTRFHR